MDAQTVRRERLRLLIEQHFNGRQARLAEAIDRQAGYVSRCLRGTKGIGEDFARYIEARVGLPSGWMDTDDGVSNTTAGPDLRSRVPVISWARAGRWCDVSDPYPPGSADEWVTVPTRVSEHAFALRVQGDSMEPKIADGAIVVIDPAREAQHGSIVLAKRTGDQQATLKQLWYDGATPLLRPANERYPILEMPPDTQVIGVAVAAVLTL